jgi:rubrerythrin
VRYYTRLAELTEDADLRELYREFSSFEKDHTDFLEKKIAEARRATGGSSHA